MAVDDSIILLKLEKSEAYFAEEIDKIYQAELLGIDLDCKKEAFLDCIFSLITALRFRIDRGIYDDTTIDLYNKLERELPFDLYEVVLDPNYTSLIVIVVSGDSNFKTFLSLLDTPDTYAGQANKIVSVKPDETGLEFTDLSLTNYVPYTGATQTVNLGTQNIFGGFGGFSSLSVNGNNGLTMQGTRATFVSSDSLSTSQITQSNGSGGALVIVTNGASLNTSFKDNNIYDNFGVPYIKANGLGNYVDLTTNQTVGGDKGFTGSVAYNGTATYHNNVVYDTGSAGNGASFRNGTPLLLFNSDNTSQYTVANSATSHYSNSGVTISEYPYSNGSINIFGDNIKDSTGLFFLKGNTPPSDIPQFNDTYFI